MNAIDQAEFDEVTQRVLRDFMRSMRSNPYSYLVVPIADAADTSGLAIERCKAIATRAGESAYRKEFAEPLLRLAMLLDQRRASPEEMQAALPNSLVNGNAVACLMLAHAMFRAGRDDDAVGLLLEGIAINPQTGAVRRELGLALRRERRFEEAAVHLEASLELRSGLRFDHQAPLNLPVTVFRVPIVRPSDTVEICFYRRRFYVYKRDEDFVRALPIDRVMCQVRRNALYKLVRLVVRILLPRPLFLMVIGWIVAGRAESEAAAQESAAPAPAPAHDWRPRLTFSWRALARAIALLMFARSIHSVDTMAEAMALARSLASEGQTLVPAAQAKGTVS